MNDENLRQMIASYANRELEQRKTWYSRAANAYNQSRPHYPPSLIAQVIEIAQLSSTSSILEVGCGPGTATVAFAPLVGPMVGVEPNPDFTHLAKQNCQAYPNVTIHNTSFEEWPVTQAVFDAVLAATSFHWIPGEVGYPKAAQTLKENGRLILLWNKELQPSYEVYQRLAVVYQHHAPSLDRYEDNPTQEKTLQDLGNMMVESGHFGNMVSGHVSTETTYTTLEYLTLLTTYSPYLELETSARQRLFAALQTLIEEEFDGKLELSYISAFHIAQKA
ncbi:class I SAM-dependent methyltransferase [Leptothoe spongobia]|uniref:Class I SAM-dependent methyltransferase n=1 Tax=Leptothoe spongobia TAU-MAC 1115 TaxID=1967444 RepID=A0A947DHU2_9CYAN|nr:class I SAM-dependent methyltransferase [Leptothoe spongobia]MBT9317221.1 class I SAM-dependent methyltransferase [Leptothoe spongobia TAU-MAC 1115]